MGKQIKTIPPAVIAPPIITPRDMTVGSKITDALTSTAVQITVPMIQRLVPMMIFNSDPP